MEVDDFLKLEFSGFCRSLMNPILISYNFNCYISMRLIHCMNSVSTIDISGPFGNEIWLTSSPSEKQWRSLCFDSEYEFRINGSSHSSFYYLQTFTS